MLPAFVPGAGMDLGCQTGTISFRLHSAVWSPNNSGMDICTTLYATRGAVTAVARKLGISDAAVSQWKTRGIPSRRLPEVEVALQEHLSAIASRAAAPQSAAQAA